MSEINIPNNVIDKDLYKEAKKIADETYKRHSAWKSMFLVREYKRLGGEYKATKKNVKKEKDRTKLWREEEWIQILPYLEKEKKKLTCGKADGKPNACRPLRRVKDGDDNITLGEIIKKFGRKKVKALTKQKLADMDGRLNWKTGTFTPS
jgi:hypothetical protein